MEKMGISENIKQDNFVIELTQNFNRKKKGKEVASGWKSGEKSEDRMKIY